MQSNLLEPGSRLGKYRIKAHIASGGMGAVYEAVDVELDRVVALKVLMNDPTREERDLQRFLREARRTAQLNHPNIVRLIDSKHDTETGLHYLVLEFVVGIDLQELLRKRGPLMPEETRSIIKQVAKALDHAFEHGIVHRDIKPANILLAKHGARTSVKLTDLGLAMIDSDRQFKLTTQGTTVGTIDYMAPEQARDSRSADIRSDIYSLGCTAYHMLAGKAPFAEGGLGERLLKHLEAEPTDVRQFSPLVSTEFWHILAKMLAKKPEHRYQTPAELLRDLKRAPAEAPSDDALTTVIDLPAERKTDVERSKSLPRKRQRKAAAPAAPLVSAEQARAAEEFHRRAAEVVDEGGGEEYARQLLANCLQLDPGSITYRQTLRDLMQKTSTGMLGRWFGSLNMLALKSKLRLASSQGDWRKVLEHGEEVLARHPGDADAHLDLAEAAEKLNLPDLAMWLTLQGRAQAPDSVKLIRALARLHEARCEWKPAIALWEQVVVKEPSDPDARQKINALSAQEHMATFQSIHGEPTP